MPRITKAERARRDEADARAKREAAAAQALHTTAATLPDLPRPDHGRIVGFRVVGIGVFARVEVAWSESVRHGSIRRDGVSQGASQGGIALHSTEIAAWRAARNEVEREAGMRLAAIDREIERLAADARRGR